MKIRYSARGAILQIALGLFLFLLSELIIRLLIPEIQFPSTDRLVIYPYKYGLTHGLRNNSNGVSEGISKRVDNNGYWKYSSDKSNSSKKIMLLGDSATMGVGVEDDSTFGGILNNTLDSLKICNPSLIGYTSSDYLNVVSYLVDSTKNKGCFNEVVICWCLNDLYPNHPVEGFPGYDREQSFSSRFISFLRNNLKLYHFIKKNFSDRPKEYFSFDEKFYSSSNEQLTNSIEHLDSIKANCDRYSIGLKVCILPYEYQIRRFSSGEVWAPQKLLSEKLTDKNITVVDCKAAFENFTGKTEDLFLYGDGIHYSKLGHKLLASYLGRIIN